MPSRPPRPVRRARHSVPRRRRRRLRLLSRLKNPRPNRPSTGAPSTVCLVTDLGRVNDGTFNTYAYEGMLRAEADLGLTTSYVETQSQTDYEANINTCLDEGFDIIVTVGFLIYDATIAAAKANPDVYFIGVDQFPAETAPNFVGIQFREDQAGYLAGVMAALMSESGKVGGV
ncbi:BMP family ABC transporter substrate-binding protein, partial [Anaerolineae bacterium CFX4]|nr:BMP family ABC transporter substrate-binding protein [Anaerolineae bacterium CFX4]